MKKVLRALCLMLAFCIIGYSAKSQTMDDYFYARGVEHLCQAAHAANYFKAADYDIHSRYVDVSIRSKDNVFGATIHTDLRIYRGAGDLYFKDIVVQSDDDMVKPFHAFSIQARLMLELYKAVDTKTYNQIRNALQEQFGTDIEHWTGKMWALFALNLDYYDYMITGK